jgi:Icc-related predicted phosphoesterase
VRVLLVSDLHYELPKFDWVLDQAGDVDLVVVAGDLLDIASSVPLDAQITVVLEYLARLAARVTTVVCSGNHDLDRRNDAGEKETGWVADARALGVAVDGDTLVVDGWTITACAWWEGPETLARLEEGLVAAGHDPSRRWLWVYHGPPEGPLAWTGTTFYGDPELPRLLEAHGPDVVLCGHVHEAPFVPEGSWLEQRGGTWLFNSGRERGRGRPAHVRLDLAERVATWWSGAGSATASFAEPAGAAPQ